nr:MAG TPA: hypothetical protein [Inoviridae sp.]
MQVNKQQDRSVDPKWDYWSIFLWYLWVIWA